LKNSENFAPNNRHCGLGTGAGWNEKLCGEL
jgi:hypothetical protein